MRMCQLSEIFNQILIHMYDPVGQNSEVEVDSCLAKEGEALKLWWQNLPDFLRIDVKTPPSQCPPSHMVTLKYVAHLRISRNHTDWVQLPILHLQDTASPANALSSVFRP
jgi:hypothetical protein